MLAFCKQEIAVESKALTNSRTGRQACCSVAVLLDEWVWVNGPASGLCGDRFPVALERASPSVHPARKDLWLA